MIHQLRIYEVDPALVEQFDKRFKSHAKRIMERYGFHIESMGYSREAERIAIRVVCGPRVRRRATFRAAFLPRVWGMCVSQVIL